jgi:hypothetical protein
MSSICPGSKGERKNNTLQSFLVSGFWVRAVHCSSWNQQPHHPNPTKDAVLKSQREQGKRKENIIFRDYG